MSDDVQVFASLADLQDCPELLRSPTYAVPRLAVKGRAIAVCGPDKSGKSTLLAFAEAALSWGRPFLGEPTPTGGGRCVHVGLEEAVGDAVRRLTDLNACAERIQVLYNVPGRSLLDHLDALLTEWPADLVVIDSLSEYARVMFGEVPANGDDAGWAAVVRPIVALARRHDVAIVIIHHTRRSDGQYRGATEIATSVDALLEMSIAKPGEDPTLRRFTGRGRWHIEPFSIVLRDDGYELGAGTDLSIDARVLLHVEGGPGLSSNEVCKRVGGRRATVIEALRRLAERGAVRNRGSEHSSSWHPVRAQAELEVV